MSRSFRNVLIVSGVLKLVLALVFADLVPRYDEQEYVNYARAVWQGGPPQLYRAPGYQWFVAGGLFLTGGGSTVWVRVAQALLATLTCFLVYRLGRRRWGERAGFWAGTFLAFYPSHVAYSHLIWSETLYTTLVVAAVDRLLAVDEHGRWRDGALAGLFLGAGILTRSLGIAVLGACCAFLVLRRFEWRRVAAAGVVGAVAVAVVAPHTIDASRRAGRLVVTDLNGGFNSWMGHHEYVAPDMPSNWIVGIGPDTDMGSRFYGFLPDSAWRLEMFWRLAREGIDEPFGPEAEMWFRARTLEAMRADPVGVARRFVGKTAALWGPDFFLPRHLARDWYGEVPPWVALVLVPVTWLTAAVPLLLGPAAVAAMRPDRLRTLTILLVAAYVFVHGMAYGHTRMHQPLVPLLLLCLAGFFFDRDEMPAWSRLVRRGLPWTALALALWVIAYPVIVTVYLVPNGRHTTLARTLAIGRHLPVPAAHRLDWMLAGAEYSAADNTPAEREAKADAVLAASRAAEHPWTLYLRGWISSDPARAEEFFRRAIETDPEHYPALEMLLWLRREAGDEDEARALAERIVRIRPWEREPIESGRIFVRPPAWRNLSGDPMGFPPDEWRRPKRDGSVSAEADAS